MAKFYGIIGYAIQVETVPGVWMDQIIEKNYRGDILQNMRRWDSSEQVNDSFMIDNKVSIISDSFAYQHLQHIKYIKLAGANWKIAKIELNRPRLILTTGGIYIGPTS